MNTDRLLWLAVERTERQRALLDELWRKPKLSVDTLNELDQVNRQAACAITELRNRAAGNKPPKLGD